MTWDNPTMSQRILIIGAHPDDCEYRCGGVAAMWRSQGDVVRFVSLTDGRSGHHEMAPDALVTRRRVEAATASDIIGAESLVLDIPDGHLEATLANRLKVIRVIREFKPDLVITNRPNDYHADHRYTAQLVQDASFLLVVPSIVPEVPALQQMPVITYFWDAFQKPSPFHADVAVGIDDFYEIKIRQLAAHESQFFEWLPWLDRKLEDIPSGSEERLNWLKVYFEWQHPLSIADDVRDALAIRYGEAGARSIHQAEAFELCEYGHQVTARELDAMFP